MSDESDYKDYQDYIAYQQHLSQQPQAPTGVPRTQAEAANYFKQTDPTLQNMMGGIGAGAAGEAVAPIVSKVVGPLGKMLRSGGDSLMQKAVGMAKGVPGLGEQLAEQGLIGTKSVMRGQAERGLASSGGNISDLASQIPNPIPQDAVANKLGEIAQSRMTPSGFVRPEEAPVVNKVLSKAQDFAQAEPISGAEMASRRVLSGKAAREAGAYKTMPNQAMKSKVASAEQAGYSDALKKAYRDAFPGNPEALADADKQYSVLSQARDAMDKPESLGSLKELLGQYIPTSLMESTTGRASIGAGKVIQSSPKTIAPLTLQNMLKPRDLGNQSE